MKNADQAGYNSAQEHWVPPMPAPLECGIFRGRSLRWWIKRAFAS